MCKCSGVQRASAKKVNAWICALAALDLESALRKNTSVRTESQRKLWRTFAAMLCVCVSGCVWCVSCCV